MDPSVGVTRVTVVEDHLLFAEALELALTVDGQTVQRVSARDQASSAAQLCAAVLETRPRVVLVDLELGSQTNGLSIIEPLDGAGVAVVVVTGCADEARWGECLWRGARTVVPKSAPLEAILSVTRRVAGDRPVISPEQADRLVRCYRDELRSLQQLRARLDLLTPREREVLAALVQGRHVREIAREEFVSEATVRTQVKAILSKLEVSSQLAAVGVARKAQWQEPRSA